MPTQCLFIDKMSNAQMFKERGIPGSIGATPTTDPFGRPDVALGLQGGDKVVAAAPVAVVSGVHWMVWSFWWRFTPGTNANYPSYLCAGGDSTSFSTTYSDAYLYHSVHDGKLFVRDNASTYADTGVIVAPDQWMHIEYAHRFGSATTGNWALYINGNQAATGVGDCDGEPWVYFGMSPGAAASSSSYSRSDYSDMVLLLSDDAVAPRTGMLRVAELKPTGTAQGQWAGSDGNSIDNHLLVDDGDRASADSVSALAGSGAIDLYTHAPLPAGASPLAVQALAAASLDAVGTDDFGIVVRSGGGTAETKHILGAGTPAWYEGAPTMLDPATGTAWTKAGVDAMTFGVSS